MSDPASLAARARDTIDGNEVRRVAQRYVFAFGSFVDRSEGGRHPRVEFLK